MLDESYYVLYKSLEFNLKHFKHKPIKPTVALLLTIVKVYQETYVPSATYDHFRYSGNYHHGYKSILKANTKVYNITTHYHKTRRNTERTHNHSQHTYKTAIDLFYNYNNNIIGGRR